MVDLAVKLGANETIATKDINDAFEFESKLAKVRIIWMQLYRQLNKQGEDQEIFHAPGIFYNFLKTAIFQIMPNQRDLYTPHQIRLRGLMYNYISLPEQVPITVRPTWSLKCEYSKPAIRRI